MSGDEQARDLPLLIEPVAAWPRQAETECEYLVTVDLRGPLPAEDGTPPSWPYPDEEFTFSIALDGSPFFVCTALAEPSVVLHRFGGTYGAATFRASTGRETGSASLWLTVSNQWGVPVRKSELRSLIREREEGRSPTAQRGDSPGFLPDTRLSERPGDRPQPELSRGSVPEARPGVNETLTISFAGFNQAWAAWVGDRLERRGLSVTYRRWDSPAGIPLVQLLRDLVSAEGRVLILLSERYFQLGPRTHEEWNRALREVVANDPYRFAAVTVTTAPMPSAAGVLTPIDLTNVGAEEAERRLLDRLGLVADPLPESPESMRQGPRFPATMPDVWGGVPRRNSRFTGREALFNDAYHLLQEGGALTFLGMPGIGKTQLAAEYVYRFGSEYDVLWWVDAENRTECRRRLAELAPQLGLTTGAGYGERVRAARDALRRGEPYSRWLVVLDGADFPEEVVDLVPSGPGHVLITSRNREWGEHGIHLLDVPCFERSESVAFVRRRAERLSAEEADQLAEALEDFPLLLAQTAGWLDDSQLPMDDYIAMLAGGRGQDVIRVSPDFPLTFRTAWAMLLRELRETAPEAVVLLRLCAFFAPGLIPVHLLREMPPDGLPDSVRELLTHPVLWRRAVNQLRQYSVVRLESHDTAGDEPMSSGEAFYLHRMVHQIVREDVPEEDRRELVDVVRRALAAADPRKPTDPPQWSAYAEIVPHLEYADVFASADPPVQNLVANCLRYLYVCGEHAAGITFGEQAMRTWRSLLGETHPRIWELTHHYANLLRAAGDYRTTAVIEREAAEHLREQRGEQDLDYLRAAGGLAADLRGLGQYEEALELTEEILSTYQELLGEQDERSLNAQNNVAVSLRLLGRYDAALDMDGLTLEARRMLLRGRHRWTLDSELSFAVDLRLLGRYVEAESVQKRNVRENRIVMGADNPQTLKAEHNLALCRYRTGRLTDAGRLLTQLLERGGRVLEETDPLMLIFATGQSCFDREHGDLDRARELGEFVVAGYRERLGDTHPYTVGAHANQALILCADGEQAQAYALAERVLDGMTSLVGPDHPWTLGCAVNASATRSFSGDAESACALSRATAARAAATLGPEHPVTLSARIALAADLRVLKARQEADKTEAEALAVLAAVFGSQHPETVSARKRVRPYWDFEPQTT